jgi:hypothetical protein
VLITENLLQERARLERVLALLLFEEKLQQQTKLLLQLLLF